MELKKEMIIEAVTTDGKPMKIGKKYVFHVGDKDFVGVYQGLGFRQMLKIACVMPGFTEIVFNITPKSVQSIYEVDVDIKAEK